MRSGTTTAVGEDLLKVDRSVEAERAVVKDVDPVALVITRSVEDRDVSGLHEVAGDEQVLLVRRNLDIVGTNDGLLLIGVIETLDVVEVRDVESSDVVTKSDGEVGKLAVVRDVGVDGDRLLSLGAEAVEKLSNTLVALGVLSEGVDDPDLTRANGSSDGSSLLVTGDKFDVLNTLTVGDGDGGENLAAIEVPKTESVSPLDTSSGLKDGQRDDEVRGEDELVLPVDAQTMGRELLLKDVESALGVLRPLVENVTLGVSLNETAGGGADSTAHVGDEEATLGLGSDLISDGAQQSAVAVAELGVVGVRGVEVVGSVLGLQERQEATTNEQLTIKGGTQMVRGVAAGRNIGDVDELTEGGLEGGSASGHRSQVRVDLTSSRETVAKKSLCWLSPAPVQK